LPCAIFGDFKSDIGVDKRLQIIRRGPAALARRAPRMESRIVELPCGAAASYS
jgi:hypothetical protein